MKSAPSGLIFHFFSWQGLSVNFYRFSFIPILVALQRASCKPLQGSGFVSRFQIKPLFKFCLNLFLKNRPKSIKVFIASYVMQQLNSFLASVLILYTLRTPERYKVSIGQDFIFRCHNTQ